MALPEAQKAYLLVKAGIVKGLSIGFEAVKDSVDAGVRYLSEIKLYEGSIVTFPMNEAALITSVKRAGETKDDFNAELNEIQLQDAGYQMRSALSCALSSLFWSGLSKDDIVTATEVIIQQFSDAYMAYVPAYIDMLTEMYGDMETWSKKRLETKEGRMISAANKESIKSALDHMESAKTIISALADDGAGDDDTLDDETLKRAAGTPFTTSKQAAETKAEPVPDHSAISDLISQAKESFSCAIS